MTEKELRDRLNRLTGEIPDETHRAFLAAASFGKEKVVVKKKVSAILVIVLILAALTLTGFAASLIYNQEWWYQNRNKYSKELNPQAYEAVMANRVENPTQQQSADERVEITIQDVSWAPEVEKLIISFRASLKDREHDELHSFYALDTDGACVGEGGSTTTTEDGEERAMHWLWRDELGAGMSAGQPLAYGRVPGYGPVLEMMEDAGKRLMLIECESVSLKDCALSLLPGIDVFRTLEGDVIFVVECELNWLNEDFDARMREVSRQYPDMQEYYSQQITAAQAARARVTDGTLSCLLTYRVREYTEGMPDLDFYTGGTTGQVEFIIQPKQTK